MLISMASETAVTRYLLKNGTNAQILKNRTRNKQYLLFNIYFSDTEASQACFRLLHDNVTLSDGTLGRIRSRISASTLSLENEGAGIDA